MYRFVFSWRWIRLHVLVWLVLIPAFIGLGMWQRGRYHERKAENAVIRTAMDAAPVPLDGVDPVGAPLPKTDRWKQVTLAGVYDPGHQFLARNHQVSGNPGFWIITPMTLSDGTSVLVNRGWIPTASADQQQSPAIPPAPAGRVQLTARLQLSETKGNTGIRDITSGLPEGQISLVNTETLAAKTGLRLRGGYAEVITSQPADAAQITPIEKPSLDEGPYLSYWFQWWLFSLIAIGGWVTIIRREAQHRVREAAEAAEEAAEDGDYEDEYDGAYGVEAEADTEPGEGGSPASPDAAAATAAAAPHTAPNSAPSTAPATAPAP